MFVRCVWPITQASILPQVLAPSSLCLGVKQGCVDLMYGSNPVDERTPSEYVQQLKSSLHDAYALVREYCKSEHIRDRKPFMMKRFTGSLLILVIMYGYIRQLFLEDSPRNCIALGRAPLRWWRDLGNPCKK